MSLHVPFYLVDIASEVPRPLSPPMLTRKAYQATPLIHLPRMPHPEPSAALLLNEIRNLDLGVLDPSQEDHGEALDPDEVL